MPLNKNDFAELAGKIKNNSGIVIAEDKEYLFESRLMPIVRKYGLQDLTEFVAYMRENKDLSLLTEVIEAMTTNESSFFRDIKPFDTLRDIVLPEIFRRNPGKDYINIWSAASSTGQEAYSIAMVLLESQNFSGKKVLITGTDIDSCVVDKAKEGLYTQFEVQRGVPITLLLKYFTQEGENWRVKDILKQKVLFKKFNLLDDASILGKFDIIFCRNVLIYFDSDTKEKVLINLLKTAQPHSHLFTGSAETLINLNTPFIQAQDLVNVFKPKDVFFQ